MDNVLVSVIIPTYNRIDYLPIAIDSVLSQTCTDTEVIIIDDGSTDHTKEVIREKYADRVIYIWQENQGESMARNRGISRASGKYIAFLDSDDYWDPAKLEAQVNFLNDKNRGNVAGVFSSAWVVDELGRKIDENPQGVIRSKKELRFENFLTKNVVLGCNILVRAECVQEIGGFDPTIQYGEDIDFMLRLRSKWEIGYIHAPLVYIRRHRLNQSTMISEAAIAKVFSDRVQVIRNHTASPAKVDQRKVDHAINSYLLSAASWCFYYEQWEHGIQYLHQAKENHRKVDDKILAARVGQKASMKFLQHGNGSIDHSRKFIDAFILKIIEKWDSSLGFFPMNGIRGNFYQAVFLWKTKANKSSFRYLGILFLKYFPQLIKSRLFIKLLISRDDITS